MSNWRIAKNVSLFVVPTFFILAVIQAPSLHAQFPTAQLPPMEQSMPQPVPQAPEPVQQMPQPVQQMPQPLAGALVSPQQLDSLVAPIALYPDPLLSQVLVAATYPLQIVQAAQWLQQNPGLTGPALEDAARQQNWDPSVQALLMFPDALRLLNENVQWTTSLGNAFLAQQADVMDAVQRLRAQAQNAGTLTSSPQMTVSSQPAPLPGAPPAVVIQPANPQVMYVPVYDPLYVWGPPVYPYPALWYPRPYFGTVLGFGPGITITALFGGWRGWGGWGWGPNWGGRAVVVNTGFFYRYGYRPSVPFAYRTAAVYGPGVRSAYGPRPVPVMPGPSRMATIGSQRAAMSAPVARNAYVPAPAGRSAYAAAPAVRNAYVSAPAVRNAYAGAPAVRNSYVAAPRNAYVAAPRMSQSYRPAPVSRAPSSFRGSAPKGGGFSGGHSGGHSGSSRHR